MPGEVGVIAGPQRIEEATASELKQNLQSRLGNDFDVYCELQDYATTLLVSIVVPDYVNEDDVEITMRRVEALISSMTPEKIPLRDDRFTWGVALTARSATTYERFGISSKRRLLFGSNGGWINFTVQREPFSERI